MLASPSTMGQKPIFRPTGVAARGIDSAPLLDGKSYESDAIIATLSKTDRASLMKSQFFIYDNDSNFEGLEDSERFSGFLRALILLDVDKKTVFTKTLTPSKMDEYIQRVTKAETVLKNKQGELTEFRVEFLVLAWEVWTQHWFYPEQSRINWCIDQEHYENDAQEFCGYWQFYHMPDGRTLAEYGLKLETNLPIPQSWVQQIQRLELPKTAWAYKKYVEGAL